jgi:predicted alpha-1,6-mannanase (GH76 family)
MTIVHLHLEAVEGYPVQGPSELQKNIGDGWMTLVSGGLDWVSQTFLKHNQSHAPRVQVFAKLR